MKALKASILGLLLASLAITSPASANPIVNVEQITAFTCVVTYANGTQNLVFCPLDVPPVACNCEHFNTPFDDICEFTPQGNVFTYLFQPVGAARVSHAGPNSPFGFFSCPRGVAPGGATCTARVTVTNRLSGASRSASCVSR